MRITSLSLVVMLLAVIAINSCSKGGMSTKESSNTGWKYNSSTWGGFEVKKYDGQVTGPGLVLVEGGRFTMGLTEQDVMYDWDNVARTVSVSSFYMDRTEVANVHYREYLYWMMRTFNTDYPEVYKRALPDTLSWRDELAYNDPFVEYYFRHPSYNFYPVVGVNWLQATDFCKWRTDRVNELQLIDKGVLDINPNQVNEDNFNTDAYLVGQYTGLVKKNLKDLNPAGSGERSVRMEDGILLPSYRLPTEAEWEYAALSLVGNQPYTDEERVSDRRLYTWNSSSLRNPKHGSWQGKFLANFKRGYGDNMGVAGELNDNADITAPVDAFMPNDYGLYNMAGNVSEWVMDVYRPMNSLTLQDFDEFRPYRGNDFQTKQLDADGVPEEKDSIGRLKYRTVGEGDQYTDEMVNRRNYKKGNVKNYWDGDEISETNYNYGVTTLVSDKSRVYKGGSWADRAYYLSPGSRRFLDEDQATCTIGFRCCMDRVGSPEGNDFKGGNNFKKNAK